MGVQVFEQCHFCFLFLLLCFAVKVGNKISCKIKEAVDGIVLELLQPFNCIMIGNTAKRSMWIWGKKRKQKSKAR